MENFFVLAWGTCSFLAYLLPVPLALVALCVWALAKQHAGINRWRLFLGGCLPLFATPLAILLYGAVFTGSSGQPVPPSNYAEYPIVVLLLTHFPLTVLLGWNWRDAKFAVLAFAAFTLYVALCAALVSAMSVTDSWL